MRAFSLLELIVVLAVSVVLAGMLLPVLSHVHDNVNRVVSGSNLRQIGLAVAMYDRDFDAIPYSYELDINERPQELAVVHIDEPSSWDGLGPALPKSILLRPQRLLLPESHGRPPARTV